MTTARSEISTYDNDIWSNSEKLNYLSTVVRRTVDLERQARARYSRDSHRTLVEKDGDFIDISYHDVVIGARKRVFSVADRLQDPYLQEGIALLAHPDNWQAIGDFLLTPKDERKPIEGYWDTLQAACGAACLGARFSNQEIMLDFNGEVIAAQPDTMPGALYEQYIHNMDIRRQTAQAALQQA